ncbi:transcription factor domain family protein [Aspergillus tubingensis]|uniref:transcription factor domain family protein n=1 Tax=Aspergillus tubingensis TaxID=5068 RepID=UPI001578F645|nr:fungal specific transcription factor domain family protein [Aspergillus tubingensis]GFN11492.1 fungal specific transcription factor domain family protein [Aspergillus tubingensis]
MKLQREPGRTAYLICLLLALQCTCFVRAESFTYPTAKEYQFIVGDLVNVSWDVVTSRVSLYEVCNTKVPLLLNVTNPYSYVWNATRDKYRESGCAFELDSLDMFGILNPPVLTSVKIGVSKRQKDDPPPEFYNLYNPTSSTSSSTSSTTSMKSTSSTTLATSTSTSPHGTSTAAAETTAASASSIPATTDDGNGLTVAQKVGIGLGVPLGVLAISIVGALGFLYRRRSQRPSGLDEPPNSDQPAPSGMLEAAKAPWDPRISRAETVIAELPSPSFEMEGISEEVNHRPISEVMGTPRSELSA